MNKIINLIVMIMILCVIGGCARRSDVQCYPEITRTNDVEEIVVEDPPYSLSFRGREEVECFFLSVNLPEDEFQKYIKEYNHYNNGIRGKEDVAELKSILMEVPFPNIPSGTLTNMEILLETNELFVRYEVNESEFCTFRIDYAEKVDDNDVVAAEQELQLWNNNSFEYRSYDEKQNIHAFLETIDGCSVFYRYFGVEENAYQTINEETVFSQIVQK